MIEMPRWAPMSAEKLKKPRLMRVDLRRSLEMHRLLALGVELAGAVLAGVYLVVFWPSAAGQVHIASVILTASLILLVAVALGAAVAVAAHNFDPRIYEAADVEQMLDVLPVAQLSDFAEVSAETTQEQIATLADWIAQTCSEDGVRRCVFTGTGIGAGVTTAAAKVREALKSMGRAALVVDAAWATQGEEPGMGDSADETGSPCNSLILTDTSPLAESPDTEFLVRFADCVIVVVESGVTTREQLQATADCLRRLNVTAAGFVVNRVRQVQTGSALRDLLKARRSAVDGQNVGMRDEFTAAVRRAVDEAPQPVRVRKRTPREHSEGQSKQPKSKPKPTTALTLVKRPPDSSAWSADGVPPWLAEALVQLEAAAPQIEHEPEAEVEESAEDAVGEPAQEQVSSDGQEDENASQQERSGAMLFEMNWRVTQPETADEQEPGEGVSNIALGLAGSRSSRLNALRGKVSAADLKPLNHSAQSTAGNDGTPQGNLPPALVNALREAPQRLNRLRGLVTPADLRELNEARAPLTVVPVNETQASAAESRAPAAGESAPQAGGVADAEQPVGVGASIAPPHGTQGAETKPTDEVSESAAKPEDMSNEPTATAEDGQRAKFDEVQILPSKRGQYRRRK
jgi:hypothetical protein